MLPAIPRLGLSARLKFPLKVEKFIPAELIGTKSKPISFTGTKVIKAASSTFKRWF